MTALTGSGNETYTWSPGTSLKTAQREIIQAALRFTQGNKVQAARLLSINRNTLHNHCAKLLKTDKATYVERRGFPTKTYLQKTGRALRSYSCSSAVWKPGPV